MRLHHCSIGIAASLFTVLILPPSSLLSGVLAEDQVPQIEIAESAEDAPAQPLIHPVMAAIQELFDAQEIQLAELNAALAETKQIREVIRIHRAIENVKVMTEIEMFRVQLRHAEKIGDGNAIEFLQQTIDGIESRIEKEERHRAELERTQR